MANYLGEKEDNAIKRIKQSIEYKQYCVQIEDYKKILLEMANAQEFDIPDPPEEMTAVVLTREEENVLFLNIIKPAFKKLIDSLVYKYDIASDANIEEFKSDCMGHLISKIEIFDYTKGGSFNFFNVVCRNHIFQYCEKKKRTNPLPSETRDSGSENNGNTAISSKSSLYSRAFVDISYLTAGEDGEDTFYQFMLKEIAKIIVGCEDRKEVEFLKHVMHILEITPNSDDAVIENKRMFYISMRSMSNLRSREITKYLSKLKGYKKDIYKKYVNH